MITGLLVLNWSATSWASLNDDGAMTWGLAVAVAGSGRTTPRDRTGPTAPMPLAGPMRSGTAASTGWGDSWRTDP